MPNLAISVSGLRHSYGDFEALRGIDLEVRRGEVFAFLGPNGAGKTTAVEILEGYRDRSAGEVSVLGLDPRFASSGAAGRAWRERIGMVLQGTRLDPLLTVSETLRLYAGYYSSPRPVEEVIGLVGLEGEESKRAGRLSGGQQRRLDVGVALIGDPDLIFLDEPTTGFDPSARRQAWEMLAGLRDLGKTIFLTTHNMEEAQFLADRVMIINRGEVVAYGTPEDLGDRSSEPTRISFTLPDAAPAPPDFLFGEETVADLATPDGSYQVRTSQPTRTLNDLTTWALENGIELDDIEVHRPSLEDTYLRLTGELDDLSGATGDGPDAGGAPGGGRRRKRGERNRR